MLNKLLWDGRLLFGLLAMLALGLAPDAASAYETLARAASGSSDSAMPARPRTISASAQ